jgi:hypothetical protein
VIVLAGVGLVLWSPLILISFRNLVSNRSTLARATTQRFLNALVQGNAGEVEALKSPDVHTIPGLIVIGLFSQCSIPGDGVGTPTVQGQNGSVPFTLSHPGGTRMRGILHLKWEERLHGWRVRSLDYPILDQPKEAMGTVPGRQPNNANPLDYRNLTALDAATFEKAWRTNLDVQNEPAGPLLRRLLSEAGYERGAILGAPGFRRQLPDPPPWSWERKPITLAMRQCSRLEIIEAVARKAGIELHQFEGSSSLRARLSEARMDTEGPFRIALRDPEFSPAVGFAGPFRVEATDFSEDGRFATGYLQLNALAVNLPVGVQYIIDGWQPALPDPVVRSIDGRDLFHRDRSARIGLPVFRVNRENRSCTLEWHVPLRNLTADVTRIGSLRGSLSVPVPVKMDTAKILREDKHFSAQIGPAKLMWKRNAGPPAKGSFTPPPAPRGPATPAPVGLLMSYDQRVPCRVCWMAIDKQGTSLQTGTLKPATEQYVSLPADWAVLEIKTFTTEEIRYPFELVAIRNPNRPPAQLAPITFPGQPAPLTCTKNSVLGRRVALELHNHTSKPVEEVRLNLRYLDRAGVELGKGVVVHPAPTRAAVVSGFLRGVTPALLLDGGASLSIYPAVTLPGATARVEVTLARVLFSDGTTWSPER